MDFWSRKRVLITGHTGFKGAWLAIWLHRLGASVTGIALPPHTSPNLSTLARIQEHLDHHICDIRDVSALRNIVHEAQPEVVFHLAAQSLVLTSYAEPVETFSSNVMGTVHLLDALRAVDSTRVAVLVTTDKVYLNHEWTYPYREDDPLGGHDPYSASKAATEIAIDCYRESFLQKNAVAVASARAGNVIGGGDWSEDRLLPDAVRAWDSGKSLRLRRPTAVRPWQHVLEPLHGYLSLAQRLWDVPTLAGAYNFGPHTAEAARVCDVIELARQAYGTGAVIFEDENTGQHESGRLTLEIAKSRELLGFHPKWSLEEAVRRTMHWYSALREGKDARRLCEDDIAAYEVGP